MSLLDRIQKFIEPTEPIWPFFFRTAALSFVPTAAIAFLLHVTGLWREEFAGTISHEKWLYLNFIHPVVVAPWFETLLMVVVFALLRVLRFTGDGLVWGSAVIWAGLHWRPAQWCAVVPPFWAFLVYSKAFLLVARRSRDRAVWQLSLVHMLHNVAALLVDWPRR